MSLHRRLERLEARTAQSASQGPPRCLERYFRSVDNYRRELDGLEPLPVLPYTEEDHQDALRTIAAYCAEPGWQIGEAKAFLDQWESNLKHKFYGEKTKGT